MAPDLPRYRYVRFLQRDFRRPVRRVHGGLNPFLELGRPHQEIAFLLLRRHQHIVFILALLLRAILEGGHAVTIFLVGEPFALVLQPVCPLGDPVTGSLVVFPLAHVRFCCVYVHVLILKRGIQKQIFFFL